MEVKTTHVAHRQGNQGTTGQGTGLRVVGRAIEGNGWVAADYNNEATAVASSQQRTTNEKRKPRLKIEDED